MKRIFSSESVTEGHPDKLCDQISDAVLDAMLACDPMTRSGCEVVASTGMVLIMGEITTKRYVDIPAIARQTIREIGYDKRSGFDPDTCAVLTTIDEQSPDIALGVDNSLEIKEGTKDAADQFGAGDQGMMFGYACDETPELMPAPIHYAHALTRQLAAVRKSGRADFILPDGKAQVTVVYNADGSVAGIDTVVVSTQHTEDIETAKLRDAVRELVINPALPAELLNKDTKYYINPTGRFVHGGPCADSGLTGRKIIVDTYGGYAPHGGGAFSGKDPTKVDRSAAYMARYAAKNLVASGLCRRCEIALAYAIGVAHPVSVFINSFGTGTVSDEKLSELVSRHFDLRPAGIIETLNLRRPIYKQTAAYGHFGRPDLDLPWEKLDKVEALKNG